MNKDKIIERLSRDELFGILTRQALILKLDKKIKFDSCLIDFNNLKKLNELLGYKKVNGLIFNLFKDFISESKTKIIIGRWFSGDEILIVGDNISDKINILKIISYKYNMSFKEEYFKNKNFKELNNLIN